MAYQISYEVRYFNQNGFKFHTKSFDCNHAAQSFFDINTNIAGRLVDKIADQQHGLPTYIDLVARDDGFGILEYVATWNHKSHVFYEGVSE